MMKRYHLLYRPFLSSMIAVLHTAALAQDTFLYTKGKSFVSIEALQMKQPIGLDKLSAPVLYEQHIPDNQPTLAYNIQLPAYTHGLFFSRDDRTGDYQWPNNTNRLLPWAFNRIEEITQPGYAGIPSNSKPSVLGDALLLQLADETFLYTKAVSGNNSISWFQVNPDGSLTLYLSTLGKDTLPKQAPLLLAEQDSSVYKVLHRSYQSLTDNKEIASSKARKEKRYFEAFDYLGWCTWEHYHFDIDETKIIGDLNTIAASGIPVRYVLIDDGHLISNKGQQLTSLLPNLERFPNGWRTIMDRRKENGIKWFGLWHSLSGYWMGIAPQNELPDSIKRTLYAHNGSMLPGPDGKKIHSFYQSYVSTLKGYGFDFLKVDNQSFTLPLYMGGTQVVEQAKACNLALEEATHQQQVGLMNCMAQNILNIDHTTYSSVARVSIDYKKYNENMAKSHLYQSYTNTLLQGQTVWPDHDMFHSSDSICGSLMARSKAISGGPVYLSDSPAEFVKANIEPLIDSSGKLFRPNAPAVPTPESILTNALQDGKSYRVIAPTGDEALSLICYNLNTSPNAQTVTARISKADFPTKERVLLYDWHTRQATELTTDREIALKEFSDHLFHLCPIRDGWAVIGLQDKYLSPATVHILARTPQQLKLRVLSPGTLAVWVDTNKQRTLRTIRIDSPKEITLYK